MTKLEEDIELMIADVPFLYPHMAKAAAEVAKKYIKEAYISAVVHELQLDHWEVTDSDRELIGCKADRWLKENGIIE